MNLSAMRKYVIGLLILAPSALAIFLFVVVIDRAIEVDGLSSQVHLQRGALREFQDLINTSMASCPLHVVEFERISQSNGYPSHKIVNGSNLIGPFQVKADGECIKSIELVGL